LEEVLLPEDTTVLKIGPAAFYGCANLAEIFLPPSIVMIDPSAFSIPETFISTTVIFGFYDSYALWWARQNGHPFRLRPHSATMAANPPGVMYKYIPYKFIAQTRVPDNEDMQFEITPALPAGLSLADGVTPVPGMLPGTVYGAPLDYTAFESGVAFTMRAWPVGVDRASFSASALFTITLGDTPDNAFLEANVNTYPFTPDPVYGGDGRLPYLISGTYDGVGDYRMHIGDGPFLAVSNFTLFDSFWIDGVKLQGGLHYLAEDGSTRVTILAQTIKDLSNGEHTAAAAFRRVDDRNLPPGGLEDWEDYTVWNDLGVDPGLTELDVVAQKFRVELTARPETGTPTPTPTPGGEEGSATPTPTPTPGGAGGSPTPTPTPGGEEGRATPTPTPGGTGGRPTPTPYTGRPTPTPSGGTPGSGNDPGGTGNDPGSGNNPGGTGNNPGGSGNSPAAGNNPGGSGNEPGAGETPGGRGQRRGRPRPRPRREGY
jgi:hypothetical protein